MRPSPPPTPWSPTRWSREEIVEQHAFRSFPSRTLGVASFCVSCPTTKFSASVKCPDCDANLLDCVRIMGAPTVKSALRGNKMTEHLTEKVVFANALRQFASTLAEKIESNGEWAVRGFIDVFKNVYTISSDTKVVSKILELCLFPHFMQFAESIGYTIELAEKQNYYPDLTFIKKDSHSIMFAVDLKTTYRAIGNPNQCMGFTLGSHGEYFINRTSKKNIQHPYGEYGGHFCLGIIYSRHESELEETRIYSVDEVEDIPAVASAFTFFAEEKWKIASDKGGSGNTANIGSIRNIEDILNGNGVFALAGEEYFDDYWANYGRLQIPTENGKYKKLSSFAEYLAFKNLPASLNNSKIRRRA